MTDSERNRATRSWLCLIAFAFAIVAAGACRAADDELEIAIGLANLLNAGRSVVSRYQDVINDPAIGDKGLSGAFVLEQSIQEYRKVTGNDPTTTDPQSRLGRLLRAQMTAIRATLDDNQATLNQKGVAFKGFVPAIFARLVNERFKSLVGREASIKSTAPRPLVRNRKSLPDQWEETAIGNALLAANWPRGKIFTAEARSEGRDAFRVLVPEYYGADCLTCHGMPKGEIDITGYPMEGGKLDELGGVISITLFR
jgi:Protein of unknown function (DUF3365)